MVHWLCLLTGGIACLWIAIQDFHKREIHVLLLGILGLSGGITRYLEWKHFFWVSFLSNVALILLLLGLVIAAYRLQGQGPVMDQKLGWGDVVLLLSLAPWMEPLSFLLFYSLCCTGLSLGFVLLWRLGRIQRDYPIPLAGFLALAFFTYSLFQLL